MAVTCLTVLRKGRVLRHCQGRGDIEANLTDLGADRIEGEGDKCFRQQCGERDMHENRIRKGTTLFNQRVVDTGGLPQEGVPVGVGGYALELGRHRNEGTHVIALDVVAEADAATPERGSDKGVGMPHVDERRTQCMPRRRWRRLWRMNGEGLLDDCWRTCVAPTRHSVRQQSGFSRTIGCEWHGARVAPSPWHSPVPCAFLFSPRNTTSMMCQRVMMFGDFGDGRCHVWFFR